MKYMGSKSRIARQIVPIIQQIIDENSIQTYWEPFVGGANVIDKVRCSKKLGSDINYYLIELLKHLDNLSYLPESLSREHYNAVRSDYNAGHCIYQPWYIGAIGFLGSYCGRFFDGGFAPSGVHFDGSKMVERNYYKESLQNLNKQAESLNDVYFFHGSYDDLLPEYIQNTLIYCDPPYANTKNYVSSKDFSHEAFWDWCRKMSANNIVLISEQAAPDDFKCIWQQEVGRTINATDKCRAVEKLFKYEG